MKVARKLLVTGISSLVIAGGMLALPLTQSVHAQSPISAIESMVKPLDNFTLANEGNASFGVKTEVDPGTHTLWVDVTNKTDKAFVPTILFDGKPPYVANTQPLNPGETRKYAHYFSGNNLLVNVQISGEGTGTYTTQATVKIQEPVSFQVTESNSSVVIGTLRNNSTLVPQTVYTKSFDESMRIEYLAPGESRTIAVAHQALPEQKVTSVTIATGAGYESTYSVELGIKPELPVPVL